MKNYLKAIAVILGFALMGFAGGYLSDFPVEAASPECEACLDKCIEKWGLEPADCRANVCDHHCDPQDPETET